MKLPSNRTVRLLIVGALLLSIGAIYRFYPTIKGIFFLEEEIAVKTRQLRKFQKIEAEKRRLEASVASLVRSIDVAESGFLNGQTPALAAVDIQNLVNNIARRSEVEIQRMRVLAPRENEEENEALRNYVRVPVQVTLNGNIRQIKEILYGIESSPKLLSMDELRIRVVSRQDPRNLFCLFTVSGLMKGTTEPS